MPQGELCSKPELQPHLHPVGKVSYGLWKLWNAAHSGSHRRQCKTMQTCMINPAAQGFFIFCCIFSLGKKKQRHSCALSLSLYILLNHPKVNNRTWNKSIYLSFNGTNAFDYDMFLALGVQRSPARPVHGDLPACALRNLTPLDSSGWHMYLLPDGFALTSHSLHMVVSGNRGTPKSSIYRWIFYPK